MDRVCPECGTKTSELTCPEDGEMTLVIKQETQADTMVGKVIGGRYRITKMVGQGGFGGVYAAQHTATGDTLAIKVLRADVENNNDVILRFRQEAKQTSKLKHPNTIRVYDFGQMDDGNLFLAMEFLSGSELTDVMRAEGPLGYKRVVKICLQVLKSLSEAHSKGLVHRDLKPDNIFLQDLHGEQDFVKVLDFGIAKALSDEQQDITSTGAVIGTPKYMSPEQARGQQVDQRTDIYSLGVILFELLSGAPPFVAETPLAMILRRVTEEPPRIHDNVALPTPMALCDVTLKSLAKNPDDRWQTADEFARALDDALEKAAASPLVQPRGAASAGGAGAGGSTAAYGAGGLGDADAGDDTAAFDSDDVTGAMTAQVVVSGQHDDATVAASAEEIALAAASQGDQTYTGPPAAVGGGGDGATVVAQLPVSATPPAPTSAPTVAPARTPTGQVAAGNGGMANGAMSGGNGSHTQIPMQAAVIHTSDKSGTPWMIFAMIIVAMVVGFALFGLVSQKAVNAPPNSGGPVAAQVQPAGGGAAQSPQPAAKPDPKPEPAAKPAAPAAPAKGTVVIHKEPAGAEVFVDGKPQVGSLAKLAPGDHSIVAKAEGFKDMEQIVSLKSGEKKEVNFKLEALPKAKPKPRPKPRHRPSSSSSGGKPKPKPRPKPRPKPSSSSSGGGGLLID